MLTTSTGTGVPSRAEMWRGIESNFVWFYVTHMNLTLFMDQEGARRRFKGVGVELPLQTGRHLLYGF